MHAQNATPVDPQLASVNALVFDIFGTVVDWRSSVARDVEAVAKRKGVSLEAARFADAWRAGYGPSMTACAAASCRGPSSTRYTG